MFRESGTCEGTCGADRNGVGVGFLVSLFFKDAYLGHEQHGVSVNKVLYDEYPTS